MNTREECEPDGWQAGEAEARLQFRSGYIAGAGKPEPSLLKNRKIS